MFETILAIALILIVLLFFLLKRTGSDAALDFCYDPADGERSPHRWGYSDTKFEFDGPRSVRVKGSRYPLAGYDMPYFLPFAEEVLGLEIRPQDISAENDDKRVDEPRVNENFFAAVQANFGVDQVSLDPEERLVHSHGQLSVDEIYRVLYGEPLQRTVDLVLYPQSEEEVRTIVQWANRHNVCLVPYGGGTNVSGALSCPAAEQRTIVSVGHVQDESRPFDRRENLQACIEAGISGKQMEQELNAGGYTSGHDPDSIEFSTLGGWISTNASGMKKNKYGNIEDIVLEATLVTPTGDIEAKKVTPRNSTGVQPRAFLFGSEGNFGIITKAILKIHPLPQVRQYGSLIFPSLEQGVRFLKELRREEVLPASIRLVNNFEFRFGQALKPAPGFFKGMVQRAQKFLLLKILRFKPLEMAACSIVMEGSRREVRHQKKAIFKTARKHGGISGGAGNGRRGYMLTFGIAYIRDFFNQFQILGETFETSVPWDCIHPVCQAVQTKLSEQCSAHQVQGKPYLSYRVTQTYHTGVCIYFTLAICGKGLEKPDAVFHTIEHSLRQTILDHGGSLSHHHGVGKIRRDFLPQIQTRNSLQVLRQAKEAMDPNNIFAIGNGPFGDS